MKVLFKKKYKDARGRIYKKGSEEGLTRDLALPLIQGGYCEPIKEFVETGILDEKGNQILKEE